MCSPGFSGRRSAITGPCCYIETRMKTHACFILLLLATAFAQESLEQLRRHWDYDNGAPLNVTQVGVRNQDQVKVYDISYASPVGDRSGFVGPNGGVVTAF